MDTPDPRLETREGRLSYWLEEVLRHPHPPNSQKWPPARSRAMSHLIRELQPLLRSSPINHADYPEILNDLWLWVSENIENFSPAEDKTLEESFRNWFNRRFKFRKLDFVIQVEKDHKTTFSIDRPIITKSGDKSESTLGDRITTRREFISKNCENLDEMIRSLQEQKTQNIGLEIELYIEQDPEGKLQALQIQSNPECHCQMLSQRMLLKDPGDRPRHIAKEFNVPEQTLYSHCRKCWKLLQQLAKELGYEQEA